MTVKGSVVILAHSRSLLVSTEGKHDREGGMRVRKVTERCSYLFLASAGVPHGEGSEVS